MPRTVARVNNPKNEPFFNKLGVDAISSTTVIAELIEERTTVGDIITLHTLKKGKLAVVELDLPEDRCRSCEVPLRDLGLIVLDEEHEWSYKQEQTPCYHARDVAVRLAALTGATCILGSATPSLEAAYRAERGEFVRLSMPRRIMGHRSRRPAI